jgi:hypothetical protein
VGYRVGECVSKLRHHNLARDGVEVPLIAVT